MLQPTDYPEPVRNHMRRRLDGAEQLPKDADWSQLDRAERKLASALWITEGSGPLYGGRCVRTSVSRSGRGHRGRFPVLNVANRGLK